MDDLKVHSRETSTREDAMDAQPSAANATGAQSGGDDVNQDGLINRGKFTSQVHYDVLVSKPLL